MRGRSILLALSLCACAPHRGDGGPKSLGDDAGAGVDGGGDGGLMQKVPCDDTHPCPSGQLCYASHCIPDNGPCVSDDDCENDSYCDCTGGAGGDLATAPCVCVPYGDGPRGSYAPGCGGPAFSASAFLAPVQKCHWTNSAGASSVIMTPLVVDLNNDGKPEIVFVNYPDGHLIAIHGADCTPVFDKPASLNGFAHLAAADFDHDGFPEIVGVSSVGVSLFDHTGTLLSSGTVSMNVESCGAPAIADVDGDGVPEIGYAGAVLKYTKGNATLTTKFNAVSSGASWGDVSVFADMDGDGHPELVAGRTVYDGTTGANETPSALAAYTGVGAYPAIADFNADGNPDIVLVQGFNGGQAVSIFDYHNNKVIFGPYGVAGGGWGGTPTVGDYDGDGVPDFGLASSTSYYVYALKCAQNPKPADCTGTDPGVLWQRTTHDASSGGTGSSTFDFNGDGNAEVAYRDECWMRVYDGRNGKTLFAQAISSGTCLEYPVIADVDNDGHADLVVPSDGVQGTMCNGTPEGQTGQMWSGPTQGIFVLTDPMNRWMPSRALWTSHSYHITEIKDDLSVPVSEPPSWKASNSYRKNVQGTGGGMAMLPDYTGHDASAPCGVTLTAQICNRGSLATDPGVAGTFYPSDPRMSGAMPICTAMTTMTLMPGQCETVSCSYATPPAGPMDVWFRADDDGKMTNVRNECQRDNDLLFISAAGCGAVH
jgi:hypothetical protein